MSAVKALFFDVFGTVVDWRSSIAAELDIFSSQRGLSLDGQKFALAWRRRYVPSMARVRSGERGFTDLDILHRENLIEVLEEFGIAGLKETDIDHLNMAWHRLDPWPDSVAGLTRLKRKFILATMSNGNVKLMVDMAKHSGLPWDMILGAEIAQSYKPDAETYLAGCRMLRLAPADCMMVAALQRSGRCPPRAENCFHRGLRNMVRNKRPISRPSTISMSLRTVWRASLDTWLLKPVRNRKGMDNTIPTKAYGDFISAIAAMQVPETAQHHAKRCVLDWFAAAVPGGLQHPATLLADAVPEDLDRGHARLVPSGRFATVRAAALINGAGSHTVEFDDIFRDGLYHPGVAVIPGALALAEETGAGGAEFLRAVIAGYEVSTGSPQSSIQPITITGTQRRPSDISGVQRRRPSCWG